MKYIGKFWINDQMVIFYAHANSYEEAEKNIFNQVEDEYCLKPKYLIYRIYRNPL